MISALDSDGRVYFALSHANTDQDTFMLFMRHLIAKLDELGVAKRTLIVGDLNALKREESDWPRLEALRRAERWPEATEALRGAPIQASRSHTSSAQLRTSANRSTPALSISSARPR